jgi:hypothetical protein
MSERDRTEVEKRGLGFERRSSLDGMRGLAVWLLGCRDTRVPRIHIAYTHRNPTLLFLSSSHRTHSILSSRYFPCQPNSVFRIYLRTIHKTGKPSPRSRVTLSYIKAASCLLSKAPFDNINSDRKYSAVRFDQ